MTSTTKQSTIDIRIFGSLRTYMDKQGVPYSLEKEIDSDGRVIYDIIQEIGLPPEKVEAIFCNGRVRNIYDPVFPGDRVALFPYGTPGPYRFFLGMARENLKRKQREKQSK